MVDDAINNQIETMRQELIRLVEDELTPISLKYGYSEIALESNIKWRPLVLVLGNYSSGKSTLINEFLGCSIQETGQAPTDDAFTVITYDDVPAGDRPDQRSFDVRDGKVLLNDPEYPFEVLKKQGERFASHFKLKKINAPFLKNLAIIDTPGMLDSVSERDRGYDYQQVIGDLAQIADLVLVLFDPHKAGTIQETYQSLRETLPAKTFEDRVVFVLNRIDECGDLTDLLKVYGTLCWNLSQMIGRKDIPRILLTYSPSASPAERKPAADFLKMLDNQRDELKAMVMDAPRHRLDHLASFVEFHAERLGHLVEGIYQYTKQRRNFRLKYSLIGLFICLLGAGTAGFYFSSLAPAGDISAATAIILSCVVAAIVYGFWNYVVGRYAAIVLHRGLINKIDELTDLRTQNRKESWQAIKPFLSRYLEKSAGQNSVSQAAREFDGIRAVYERGSKEIRRAINDISTRKRLPTDRRQL
jgi:ribosome biogenesis GTPase A